MWRCDDCYRCVVRHTNTTSDQDIANYYKEVTKIRLEDYSWDVEDNMKDNIEKWNLFMRTAMSSLLLSPRWGCRYAEIDSEFPIQVWRCWPEWCCLCFGCEKQPHTWMFFFFFSFTSYRSMSNTSGDNEFQSGVTVLQYYGVTVLQFYSVTVLHCYTVTFFKHNLRTI